MIIPGLDESFIVDGHPNFGRLTPQQIENDAPANQSAEIARDAACKFILDLATRDSFYYPHDPEHPGLVRDAVSVAESMYRNSYYVRCEDPNLLQATQLLAYGSAMTALMHIDKAKSGVLGRGHSAKRSLRLDNGKKVSPIYYLRHEWVPQYAEKLTEFEELDRGMEVIS